jgi:hypothetical protein
VIFTSLLADLSFSFGMRIVLAGVLGGIVMFIWTSIAHMALPLGEAGIREIRNESAVLGAIQSSMSDKTSILPHPEWHTMLRTATARSEEN